MTLMDIVSSILDLHPLNETIPERVVAADYISTYVFIEVYPILIIGVPLNLLVMYLSFIDKSIENNYKYLLGNVAICDTLLICGLLVNNHVYWYLVEKNLLFTPIYCTHFRIWMYTFAACYFSSLPLVSIHRYITIVREKGDIFTNRKILCMCLFAYWPLLYPILTFSHPTHYVKDIHCGFMYWFPFIRELMLLPAGLLNIFSVFCIIKVLLYIRRHIKSVSGTVDLSRLKDERSLMVALTIQVVIPIVGSVPIALLFVISALSKNLFDLIDRSWYIFGMTVSSPYLKLSLGIFELCPLIDPLLTLFCVRQYRRIVKNWFRRCISRERRSTVQSITYVKSRKSNHSSNF